MMEVKTLPCMWNKPRELTSYIGDGYEIAYWSSEGATAAAALNGWKKAGAIMLFSSIKIFGKMYSGKQLELPFEESMLLFGLGKN